MIMSAISGNLLELVFHNHLVEIVLIEPNFQHKAQTLPWYQSSQEGFCVEMSIFTSMFYLLIGILQHFGNLY